MPKPYSLALVCIMIDLSLLKYERVVERGWSHSKLSVTRMLHLWTVPIIVFSMEIGLVRESLDK